MYKFTTKIGKNTKEENNRILTLKEKTVIFIWFATFISMQTLMIAYIVEWFDIMDWILSI
jgi:hypothetical protein